MSFDYSNFTHSPYYKLISSSAPYCIFRNRERYIQPKTHDIVQYDTKTTSTKVIDNQVRLYLDRISNSFIPSRLLYGTIRRDMLSLNESKDRICYRNSVISCQHNNENMFIHLSGRYMDELILRNSSDIYYEYDLYNSLGYTIPISHGTPILQLLKAGETHFGIASHILANTTNEIYHLTTSSMDEMISSNRINKLQDQFIHVSKLFHDTDYIPTILEPLHKYELPYSISNTTSIPSNNICYSKILTTCGRLYTWTLSEGCIQHRDHTIIPKSVSIKDTSNSMHSTSILDINLQNNTFIPYIECSLNPLISYMSIHKVVLIYDERSASNATYLCNENNNISIIKQDEQVVEHLYVSYEDKICLYDIRNTKTYVTKYDLPVSYDQLKYYSLPYEDTSSSILLGGCEYGSQMHIHSITNSFSIYNNNEELSALDLVKAATPLGLKSSIYWDMDGYSVIDASSPGKPTPYSLSTGLWGLELVNVSEKNISEDEHYTNMNNSSNTNNSSHHNMNNNVDYSYDEDNYRNNKKIHNYQSLLVQQSSFGDVYVQKMSLCANPFKKNHHRDYVHTNTFINNSNNSNNSNTNITTNINSSDDIINKNKRKFTSSSISNRFHSKYNTNTNNSNNANNTNNTNSSSSDDESDDKAYYHNLIIKNKFPNNKHVNNNKQYVNNDNNNTNTNINTITNITNNSIDSYKRVVVNNANLLSISTPPIQMFSPCGLRCFANNNNNNNNNNKSISRKKNLRDQGLVIFNSISNFDCSYNNNDNSNTTTTTTNMYPLSNHGYLPFIPEDCLKPFDLLKITPELMHNGIININNNHNNKNVEDIIIEYLSIKSTCTLWEIFKYLIMKETYIIDLYDLRILLNNNIHIIEQSILDTNIDNYDDNDQMNRSDQGLALTESYLINSKITFDNLYIKEKHQVSELIQYRDKLYQDNLISMYRKVPIKTNNSNNNDSNTNSNNIKLEKDISYNNIYHQQMEDNINNKDQTYSLIPHLLAYKLSDQYIEKNIPIITYNNDNSNENNINNNMKISDHVMNILNNNWDNFY